MSTVDNTLNLLLTYYGNIYDALNHLFVIYGTRPACLTLFQSKVMWNSFLEFSKQLVPLGIQIKYSNIEDTLDIRTILVYNENNVKHLDKLESLHNEKDLENFLKDSISVGEVLDYPMPIDLNNPNLDSKSFQFIRAFIKIDDIFNQDLIFDMYTPITDKPIIKSVGLFSIKLVQDYSYTTTYEKDNLIDKIQQQIDKMNRFLEENLPERNIQIISSKLLPGQSLPLFGL